MLKTAFAVAGIVLGWVHYAHAWEQKSMNAQIDQTDFLMNNNCSATLIDKDKGYLLTANHCVADQYQIVDQDTYDKAGKVTTTKVRIAIPGTVSQLVFNGPDEVSRTLYVVQVVKSDAATDLALVQVMGKLPNTQAAPIASVPPVRGDKVFAVGNPLVFLYASVSEGIVASTQRNYRMIGIDSDNGFTQTTTSISGGSSGGALYNDRGELIGVVVRGAPGIALSVPLSDILAFLKDVA